MEKLPATTTERKTQQSRKRSAEPTEPASPTDSHKRAASEPLQHPNSKRPTPSPPLPMNSNVQTEKTPSQSNDPPLIGCLPLDLLLYIASFVGESELIRLSCCSKGLRRGLIRSRFLWTRQLTLNVSRTDLADQIRTLYLERIQLTQPGPITTSQPNTAIGKWLTRMNSSRDLMLKTLRIRLPGPQLTIDTIHNKIVINPEETYWNAQVLTLNFKLIKELMHKPVSTLAPSPPAGTPDARQPERLQVLDIRIDGHFEQSLAAASEAWMLAQSPWAKSVKEYRLSVGYGLARIPSFSLIALSSWMPNLKSFEVRMGTLTANEPHLRRQQQRQQRFVLGGTEFSEMTPGLRSAQLIPCTIERLHLEGICFSPNLLLLPQLFPNLKFLVLRSITWGRMIYELIRRSPSLEILKLIDFCFDQEMEEDLPSDWNFNSWEDEMSETGSDEGGVTLRAPPINSTNLTELHLMGEGTPHIWSVLGESIQNPIIKMPRLEKLVCEALDLEEEEQALIDLSDLAPNLREISIRNCILRDEVDLYHCIRCLPDLELLDCRLIENITSNLINALALSVPNIRHLDVRGCPYVHVTSVARLAETIRDSSDSERRIEYIGVDKPPEPLFGLESAQEDSVKWEIWQLWQAWNWLDFTHVLLDQEEWKARHRGRKDKMPVRPEPPAHLAAHRSQEFQQASSHQGPRIRLTSRLPRPDPLPNHHAPANARIPYPSHHPPSRPAAPAGPGIQNLPAPPPPPVLPHPSSRPTQKLESSTQLSSSVDPALTRTAAETPPPAVIHAGPNSSDSCAPTEGSAPSSDPKMNALPRSQIGRVNGAPEDPGRASAGSENLATLAIHHPHPHSTPAPCTWRDATDPTAVSTLSTLVPLAVVEPPKDSSEMSHGNGKNKQIVMKVSTLLNDLAISPPFVVVIGPNHYSISLTQIKPTQHTSH
ncbi:hypothetical protein PtB15_16B59 [Puccinia triticina]|nr:hypothetical protein PtB15_16B59 [Puccinia triticina]